MRSYVISAFILTTILFGYTTLVLLNKKPGPVKLDAHSTNTKSSEILANQN